jgi:hypothetical protein
MRLRFTLALLLATASLRAQEPVEGPLPPPPSAAQTGLTNQTVIKMTKAGLEDSIILQTIRSRPTLFATGPDDLIALKDAGVSQPVIAAMVASSSGLATHTPEPVKMTPVSPNVDDIGVYYKAGESDWQNMPSERVNYRAGGALKSVFTNNIIKKDMNGHVSGAFASLQLKPGDQVLLFAPQGVEATEYVLLRFRQHADDREFRTETGNVFHSETGADRDSVAFTATKVATHMFQFTIPETLKPGEYGVLPPGAANQRGMAVAGKIYTFAIKDPHTAKK